MTQKPHILFVINEASYVISHRLHLIKEALNKGWRVSVMAPEIENYQPFLNLKLEVDIKNFDIQRKGLNPFKELKGFLGLYSYIKQTQPDLIHGVTLKPAFYAGLIGRFFKKIKQVHMFNGLGFLFTDKKTSTKIIRFLLSPLFKFAFAKKNSIALFQNTDDQKTLINLNFITKPQAKIIRGSGVDLEVFKKTDEPINEAPIVLLPARLIQAKGIDEFVEAARNLKSKNLQARFCIAGPLDDQNPTGYSEEQIKKWVKNQWIEYLGNCQDMPAIYRQSNIVCLPSFYGEGLPKCLLEAAATGRAIITTNHTGCREAVDHDVNGYLIPIKDSKALEDALEKLIINKQTRLKFGSNSRLKAEQEFSNERVLSQTFDVYNDLLSKSI